MKVLVTGASGFIGQYIIRDLLKRPGIEIIATSRNIQKARSLDFFHKVNFVELDISRPDDNFFSTSGQVDALVHLAWDGLPNYKENFHIEKNLFENYRFCKKMLDAGLKNLTVIGTCFEYGMIDGCLNENMEAKPSNPYAIAKDSLRKFLEILQNKQGFAFKWIRLFYMYGKGQASNSLIPQLESAIARGDKEFNMSGGEQLRDYLPVGQIAEYINACALQTKVGGIINCSSGRPVSVRRFVENYLEDRKASIKLNLGYYPYADYEPMAFWGDNTKLASILRDSE